MNKPDHVLVVAAERGVRQRTCDYLIEQGIDARGAASLRELRAALRQRIPDLVVLDVILPGEAGMALCQAVRDSARPPPPLIVTSGRNEQADRILALELGADDVLGKPFAARELLARIRAVLRRARMLPPNMQPPPPRPAIAPQLRFGRWRFEPASARLIGDDGAAVAVSGGELRLLRAFLDHPRHVLSRDQLLALTHGDNASAFDRSIDILVSRLRQRLGALGEPGRASRYIKTIRSEGYLFTSAVTRPALAEENR